MHSCSPKTDLSHDIAYDLFTGYTESTPRCIDKPEWDALAASVPRAIYRRISLSRRQCRTCLARLMVQAGFTIWPDVASGMIEYAALRPGPVAWSPTGTGSERSLSHRRRDDQRISQVIMYTEAQPANRPRGAHELRRAHHHARSRREPIRSESIREMSGAAVSDGGQVTARCGERLFAMYSDPPIEARFQHDARHTGDIVEAQYFSLEIDDIQDDVGEVRPVAMAAVSVRRGENTEEVEGKSVRFAEFSDDPTRQIIIDTNEFNINLRTLHDLHYAAPVGGEVVEFEILTGIIVGSTATGTRAIVSGSWPDGVTLTLINAGRIQGKGGAGGGGGNANSGPSLSNGVTGETGGDALFVEVPISVDNTGGEIWGGGGGGGGGAAAHYSFEALFAAGGGGGGGAGTNAGAAGAAGTSNVGGGGERNGTAGGAGTATSGGGGGTRGTNIGSAEVIWGGDGGAAGGPGLAGTGGGNTSGELDPPTSSSSPGGAGAAGRYIVGNSLVTWIANGDRRGGVA